MTRPATIRLHAAFRATSRIRANQENRVTNFLEIVFEAIRTDSDSASIETVIS
jgi:hypothetical protein